MKLGVVAAGFLLCAVTISAADAAVVECAEFEGGEALCDDGSRMFYRANPSASFVALDGYTRLKVIAYLSSLAENTANSDEDDGAFRGEYPSNPPGDTVFFPNQGSIFGSGDCVSLSAPGISYMGSGC